MSKGAAIKYSACELAWVKAHRHWLRRKAHQKFCEKFTRTDVTLSNYSALCKRNGWITGRTGRFPKGCVPLNKGKKMPYNANSARTQFKKGQLPHNTKFTGHERLSKNGYIEISIDEKNPHTGFERRYVLKHRYLWEKENGKLPKGMCLKCLDGNVQNTAPDNWVAIPRGALPYLNGHRGFNYAEMPDELKPSVLVLARLKHAKNAAIKKENSSQVRP